MFTHPKPTKPQIVRDLDAITADTRRELGGLRGSGLEGLIGVTARMYAGSLMGALTDEEREQVAAYNRQVTAYNAAVDAYNAAVDAYNNEQRERRAKAQAARETAKVRAARCGQCFTIHSAGQTDCW